MYTIILVFEHPVVLYSSDSTEEQLLTQHESVTFLSVLGALKLRITLGSV
jgi:hypothetical protein